MKYLEILEQRALLAGADFDGDIHEETNILVCPDGICVGPLKDELGFATANSASNDETSFHLEEQNSEDTKSNLYSVDIESSPSEAHSLYTDLLTLVEKTGKKTLTKFANLSLGETCFVEGDMRKGDRSSYHPTTSWFLCNLAKSGWDLSEDQIYAAQGASINPMIDIITNIALTYIAAASTANNSDSTDRPDGSKLVHKPLYEATGKVATMYIGVGISKATRAYPEWVEYGTKLLNYSESDQYALAQEGALLTAKVALQTLEFTHLAATYAGGIIVYLASDGTFESYTSKFIASKFFSTALKSEMFGFMSKLANDFNKEEYKNTTALEYVLQHATPDSSTQFAQTSLNTLAKWGGLAGAAYVTQTYCKILNTQNGIYTVLTSIPAFLMANSGYVLIALGESLLEETVLPLGKLAYQHLAPLLPAPGQVFENQDQEL